MTTPARTKVPKAEPKLEPPPESPVKGEARRIIARVIDTSAIAPATLAALQLLGIIIGQLDDLRTEISASRAP